MENEKENNIKYFLKALVNDVFSPIFIVDENKNIKSFNKAVLNLFQKSKEQVINKRVGEAFGCALLKKGEICRETKHCASCLLNINISKAVSGNEAVLNKIIKKEFYINNEKVVKSLRLTIKPINRNKNKLYVVILDDVTEEVELQEKIKMQNEKMKRDLLVAKGIQNGLLPEEGSIGSLKLNYMYRPCEALGGDFIDFYKIDNKHVGIIMADVSGHGLASSMFTVFLYSLIDRKIKSPAEVLQKVFMEFSKFKVSSETYITMFSIVYNTKSHVLTIANAGFTNPPSIRRNKGIELLDCAGIPISNWVKETTYDELTTKFKKGERLIMFSDGMTEAMDKKGNMLGNNFIVDILAKKEFNGQEAVSKALFESRKKANAEVKDDITIAVIDNI